MLKVICTILFAVFVFKASIFLVDMDTYFASYLKTGEIVNAYQTIYYGVYSIFMVFCALFPFLYIVIPDPVVFEEIDAEVTVEGN